MYSYFTFTKQKAYLKYKLPLQKIYLQQILFFLDTTSNKCNKYRFIYLAGFILHDL